MRIAKTVMVEGDSIALDALLFQIMGREDLVPAVLDANPGLARLGPILPVGTQFVIPEPDSEEAIAIRPSVTLWSE